MEDTTENEGSFIGRTLGGFRVLRHLGRGGMGEVYLAYEESLGRKVVLKFLAARWLSDANLVKRFAREVRAAARLNHPNVVTIYSFHEVEGLTFYAMEYIEGRSLAQLIAREAPLDVGRALTIAAQVADALACAHKAGILHRDIKPSNISVTPEGLVKVLDFGIAKILGENTDLTTDGAFLGTLAYASPEQCEGAALDARTDVYSLGVVLYEMLAGRPPHTADTPLTLIRRIVNEPPPDLETFNSRVSVSVKRLIARMLEKQRDLRLASGEAVAEAIRQASSEMASGLLADTVGPTEVAAPPPAQDGGVPLGRPVDSPSVAPRSRYRSVRRIALWIFGVWLALALLNRAVNGPNARKAAKAPVATPTPTSEAPTPAPEATPAQALLQPTVSPRVGWPNVTPIRATPALPIPPTAPFSAQTVLQLVPADRDLVMDFNVRSLLQSQLIRSNESKVFSREATTNLDTFFGNYGVDWRRDIDHLIVSGITARPETLCLTFQGRWDESSIVNQLRKNPAYKVLTYSSRQIHSATVPAGGREECVTFLAPGIAACGSLSTLQQVCDAATGRASLVSLPMVRNAIANLEGSPDFWILGVRQTGPTNPALAGLDAWVLRGRLTPGLDLVGIAWPRDTKQIEGAYNLMRLVVEAWKNNKTNPDLRKLGSSILVERSADTLSVNVSVPYADMVRLLDDAAAKGNYPFK